MKRLPCGDITRQPFTRKSNMKTCIIYRLLLSMKVSLNYIDEKMSDEGIMTIMKLRPDYPENLPVV